MPLLGIYFDRTLTIQVEAGLSFNIPFSEHDHVNWQFERGFSDHENLYGQLQDIELSQGVQTRPLGLQGTGYGMANSNPVPLKVLLVWKTETSPSGFGVMSILSN